MTQERFMEEKKAKMIADIQKWLETEEGQVAIRDAMAKADEAIRQLEEARKISWAQLHEPMTI